MRSQDNALGYMLLSSQSHMNQSAKIICLSTSGPVGGGQHMVAKYCFNYQFKS